MKKIVLFALLIALAAFILSGCVASGDGEDGSLAENEMPPLEHPMFEDAEAIYKYYNEVTVGDTLQSVIDKFGEPKVEQGEGGNSYAFIMEDGYGFVLGADERGRILGKMVYYDDPRQFGKVSDMQTFDSALSITTDYTFSLCKAMLGGKPMEILQRADDTSVNPNIDRLYLWCNERGDFVNILFSSDGKVLEYGVYVEPDRSAE